MSIFSFMNPVKTAIVGVLSVAVLGIVTAGYLHYRGLTRDLEAAQSKATRLEVQVAVQDATIAEQSEALSDWRESAQKMQRSLQAMTETARTAGEETRRLNALFAEHDLGRIAARKPSALEALVDAGSDRMRRLLECASGADRQDCDGRGATP
jgi:uncharacterized coiled-coil protein SlyX